MAKWRIGAECGNDVDEWPGRTEEIIPTVARALGEGIDKLVDANSGFSVSRAIAVGQMLAARKIKISMDGKGARRDNVFVERLWRTIK